MPDDDLRLHPLNQRFGYGVRPFDRRQMPAIRNDDETCARNSADDLLRQRRRGQFIAFADKDERWAPNRGQPSPRILPADDRSQLAQESLRAGFRGHGAHEAFERLTAVTRPMHEYRKQPVRHFGETTGLGSVNDRPAVLGLLRGLGV